MKNNEIYKCPVCGIQLKKNDITYKCSNNHSFDIAREGYTYLLLANKKNSKIPGDSKEMVVSRHNFLQKGYYKGLSDALNETVKKYILGKEESSILDAGCGEGYYIDNLARSINNQTALFGIDISKEAVRIAAKRNNNIETCVASVF